MVKNRKLIFPIDRMSGSLVLELLSACPESEEQEVCQELRQLGYSYVSLPVNAINDINSFRQLWQQYITNKTLSNLDIKTNIKKGL